MKYIRTKDGYIIDTSIYKTVVERTFNGKVVAIDLNHWGQDNDKHITWIDVKNIIKQADTIEELCDEFVCNNSLLKPTFIKRDDEGYPLETYHQGIINSFKNGVNYKNYDWFGAIWTDKGLIYVAKLNNKGELELI